MIRQNSFMKKLLGILLTIALVTGSVFGNGAVALAEGETKAGAVTKVACVGDSLTEGYTSSGGLKGATAYPARLQGLLGSGYEVKNYGKTSYALMKNNTKSYWNTTEFHESTAYGADNVIIMLGTNDSKAWNAEA